MARTRVSKMQKIGIRRKSILNEISEDKHETKENNTPEKNITKTKQRQNNNKTPKMSQKPRNKKEIQKSKTSPSDKADSPDFDIEGFLRGDVKTIQNITDMKDLKKTKELYKKTVKRILNAKKKEILSEIVEKRQMLLETIPTDVMCMPFICFLIGLKNNYVGNKIISKRKIDAVRKKPSIIVKMEDQTIIIEGSDVKVEGNNQKKFDNKFINDIKNIYENYYGNYKKK